MAYTRCRGSRLTSPRQNARDAFVTAAACAGSAHERDHVHLKPEPSSRTFQPSAESKARSYCHYQLSFIYALAGKGNEAGETNVCH
jgi:hypothetical protein